MRILLVEDDAMVGAAVAEGLRGRANAVDWLRDGVSALTAPAEVAYDCVLLDLGLPGMDGLSLLSNWRREGIKTPVIILTARDSTDDRVRGLDLGADDYVVKPFELREVIARLHAVTRRGTVRSSKLLSNGSLSLDPDTHEVNVDGKAVELTAREFSLLEALLQRPGAVLSRAALEERIYSYDEEVDSNAVEYLIHTLRRKIGADAIKNVRGIGWKVARGA